MKAILPRQTSRCKRIDHGFETLGDILRRYEQQIILHRFDADLSLKLDAAHLLREEMHEGRRA